MDFNESGKHILVKNSQLQLKKENLRPKNAQILGRESAGPFCLRPLK